MDTQSRIAGAGHATSYPVSAMEAATLIEDLLAPGTSLKGETLMAYYSSTASTSWSTSNSSSSTVVYYAPTPSPEPKELCEGCDAALYEEGDDFYYAEDDCAYCTTCMEVNCEGG